MAELQTLSVDHSLELAFPALPTPPHVPLPSVGPNWSELEHQYIKLRCPSKEVSYSMTITEIKEVLSCHDAGLCRVYRATMRSEAEPDQCYEVVCKLAIGRRHFNRLSDEAAIYKKLGSSPPVGTRVPKCYGLFVGEIYDGKIAVLMLADCGEQLEVSMAHQPLTFRSQIIDHLLVLHQDAGVELGGFTEQNIVVKSNGRGEYWPTIVGFGYAHQSHTCDKFDGKIALYTPLPEVEAIGCPELWDALKKLELYIPSTFQFMGQDIPIEYATEPEKLVADFFTDDGITDPDVALEYAVQACLEFGTWVEQRDKWDNASVRVREEKDDDDEEEEEPEEGSA